MFVETTLPYLDLVYGVACGIARDRHLAEDLVQETYLRAFAAFDTHDRTRTRGWLVAILLNAARSEGRRRARRGEVLVADVPDVWGGDGIGDAAIAADERERIVRALAAIPDEQRLAVVLMDVAGMTAQEVADAFGCPRGTVLAPGPPGAPQAGGPSRAERHET